MRDVRGCWSVGDTLRFHEVSEDAVQAATAPSHHRKAGPCGFPHPLFAASIRTSDTVMQSFVLCVFVFA